MAFTATHEMKLNSDPNVARATLSLANACINLDRRGILLTPEGLWTGTVHVYANAETFRNNIFDWIPGCDFTASTSFVAEQDSYDLLYAAVKSAYSNTIEVE